MPMLDLIAHVHSPWTLVMTLIKLVEAWILHLQLHTRMWLRQSKKILQDQTCLACRYFPVGSRSCSGLRWLGQSHCCTLTFHSQQNYSKLDNSFCMQAANQGTDTLPALGWCGAKAVWQTEGIGCSPMHCDAFCAFGRLNCKSCATLLLEVCQCQKRSSIVLFVGPPPRDWRNVWQFGLQ